MTDVSTALGAQATKHAAETAAPRPITHPNDSRDAAARRPRPARDATGGDWLIRASTAATVVAIGGIAAVVSFRHALEVVRQNGESGQTAYLTPLTVDGLVFTASMVLLDAARRGHRPPMLARVALVLGIAATVAANLLHGWAYGPVGAVVGAWPAVTLVLVVELLMGMIRRGRRVPATDPAEDNAPTAPGRATLPAAEDTPGDSDTAPEAPVPAPVPDAGADRTRADRTRPDGETVPAPTLTLVPAVPGDRAEVRQEGRAEVYPPLGDEPLRERAAIEFADDIKAGKVPSIRRIKSALRCGQPKASQVRAYLATLTPDATAEEVTS